MAGILLHDAFRKQILERGDAIALATLEDGKLRSTSWRELGYYVGSVMRRLSNRIDAQNRRIGYLSRNTLQDIVLTIASANLGAINVPISYRLQPKTQQQLWGQIGGCWIDDDECEHWLNEAFHTSDLESESVAVEPTDAALILWTSGTSRSPRAVVLSHQALAENANSKLIAAPQYTDDIRLTCLPLSHAYARTCDFGTWLLSGGALALADGFSGWLNLAPLVRPTVANVVPSIADRLLELDESKYGLSRLRMLGCGGAGLSSETFAQWKSRGVSVIQGYGCTETAPVICSATPTDARPGLVGKPVEGWQTEIRGGRLFVRGVHLMSGYWNDAIETHARIDSEGWFDTGDSVEIDNETGQFRILGRADDVIVLPNGHKIHPMTIERLIEELPNVNHAMMYFDGKTLRIWIEGIVDDQVQADIQQVLQTRQTWERPTVVNVFPRPLSESMGELTAKGSLCRKKILENLSGTP